MNETQEQDLDIQEVMRMSLVNEEPSEELLRNLRVLAGKAAPKKRLFWLPGLATAGAIAVTALLLRSSLTPTKASAKSFESLLAAAGQVNSFLFTIDSHEHSKETNITIAGINGKFSLRTEEGTIMQFDAGTLRTYDPKENTITELKFGGVVDSQMIADKMQEGMSQGFKEMNLKKALKDYETKYGRDHIKISPVTREGGKDVYHVTMDSPKESGRVEMVIDAETDLPERIEAIDPDAKDGDSNDTTIRMQFGTQIDPKVVVPDFPANAKKVQMDLGSMIGSAMKGGIDSLGPMLNQLDPNWKDKVKDATKSMKGMKIHME